MGCKVINITFFPIFISAATLNSVGIYLLSKDKHSQTNQNLILKFLSTIELTLSCILLINWSFVCHGSAIATAVEEILLPFIHCCFFNITLIMVIMTFDRLVATKYPLRYSSMLSRKKIRLTLSVVTALCMLFGVLSLFDEIRQFLHTYDTYIFHIPPTFAALFIVIAYANIFMTLLQRRNLFDRSGAVDISRFTENRRFLKMAAVITITYFAFYTVPDVASLFCKDCFTDSVQFFRLLWNLGPVFDPITFIFMQERLRKRLINMVQCCHKKDKGNDTPPRINGNDNFAFDTRL